MLPSPRPTLRFRPLALVLAAAALSPLAPGQELFADGDLDQVGAWSVFPADANAEHTTDLGASKDGCLYLSNDESGSDKLKMWMHAIHFDAGTYKRLRLRCKVRTKGLEAGTQVQLMSQVITGGDSGGMIAFPRTAFFTEDCDWTATETVFDVAPEAVRLRLLFFVSGPGEAWLDDVSVTETDDPVTAPGPSPVRGQRPQAGRFETLARGAAGEIPWLFDGAAAKAAALEASRPMLVYVRCTDAKGGVESMSNSLEAPEIRLQEDGMLKDVVFRAGPLSTPRISEYVKEHFVPVCLSYGLAQNNSSPGAAAAAGWGTPPSGEGVATRFDPDEGATGPGSLRIERTSGDGLLTWFQSFDWSGESAELELSAAMSVSDLQSRKEANVMVQCWKADKAIAFGRLKPMTENASWTHRTATFKVPEGTDRINLIAYLNGTGVAHFDDLSVRQDEGSPNLLQNGSLSGGATTGLGGLPIQAALVTTPALVVVGANGEEVATLDRIGSLSDEFIADWLQEALQLARGEGRVPKVARPHAKVRGALKLATEGKWTKALEASDRAIRTAGEEAQFLKGLCHQRLGQHAEANEVWSALASESPWGRKAAACLLPNGPRLHEALTLRLLPSAETIASSTENLGVSFSPARSLSLLIELQRADGSFGSHVGALGKGWNDVAITALAVDAMREWESHMPRAIRKRIAPTVERSVTFLQEYARTSSRASTRSAAFVNPYVLRTLLRMEETGSAQQIVEHIQTSQDEDGNWSVYGSHRPASFNTAQNVIALLEARQAGLEVSDETVASGVTALEAMLSADSLFPYSTADGHEWMTTTHGSIGRDPLCEHALLLAGGGSKARLNDALERYMRSGEELRVPTKRLYDYFNSRGHGGYFFFFAHHRALEVSDAFGTAATQKRVAAFVRQEVLGAQEGDGAFIDHYNIGRAYGTAQALILLARD